MPITGTICGIIMSLLLTDKDVEDNGKWNHLLVAKRAEASSCGGTPVSGEIYISWSQVDKPLKANEGDRLEARITATCELGMGIDESQRDFWASYNVWTCDATKVEEIR